MGYRPRGRRSGCLPIIAHHPLKMHLCCGWARDILLASGQGGSVEAIKGLRGAARRAARRAQAAAALKIQARFRGKQARQAAEAAIAAYSGRADLSGGQAAGNMEIITALADDLKALENLSRQSEERNLRAFQGVQETLLKIAERLEALQTSDRSATPAQADRARSDAMAALAAASGGDLGSAIPWSLVRWTIPGVLVGGQLAPRLASRGILSDEALE